MVCWVTSSVKKVTMMRKLLSKISLLHGKAKSLLEKTTLLVGCLIKVFYKRTTYPKQPLLKGLCRFECTNKSLQVYSAIA